MRSWFVRAVFAVDRRLRRRQGSFEYSQRADCLFRIQPCFAEETVVLADGTQVRAGERALKLHFWNEHLPRMGRRGPTFGWARGAARGLQGSLRELSHYLARHPEYSGVRVLFGDMSLAGRQTGQLQRLIRRYGFETPLGAGSALSRLSLRRRIGITVLVLLLMLATNPSALRRALLRHRLQRVYLSRAMLDARYGRSVLDGAAAKSARRAAVVAPS